MVYLLCRFFQRDPKTVRILFLDAHPKGNLDILWSKLFYSFTRLGQLKNISSILYHELIWSQAQPESEIDVQRRRTITPSFFSDFRQHILNQFHIDYQNNDKLDCKAMKVYFLLRGNYVAHPRNPSGKIGRKLLNGIKIVDDLKMQFSNSSNIKFTFGYFEQLTIEEQLRTIVDTDLFVGMHGAGLTHVIFLKPNRTLIELNIFRQSNEGRHFKLLASFNNVNYHLCLIYSRRSTTAQSILNCMEEKMSQMCPTLTMLTKHDQNVRRNAMVREKIPDNRIKRSHVNLFHKRSLI